MGIESRFNLVDSVNEESHHIIAIPGKPDSACSESACSESPVPSPHVLSRLFRVRMF